MLMSTAAIQPPLYQKFLHTSSTKGGRGQGGSNDEDPYMKYETKWMLCELQRPFNKALVNLLPNEPFEWANSRYC